MYPCTDTSKEDQIIIPDKQLNKEVQMPRSKHKNKTHMSGQNSMSPLKPTSLIEWFPNENHLDKPQDLESKNNNQNKFYRRIQET